MRFFEVLLDLLFPRRCIFCGELMEEQGPACKACEGSLPFREETLCSETMEPLDGLYCALSYEKQLPRGIANFKFHGKSHLAVYFSQLMMTKMGQQLRKGQFDLVVAVPMQGSKLRKRGYNQARSLAEQLSKELQVPCSGCLKKIRRTKTQHELSGWERRSAQKDSYGCEALHGEKILLVDDICTTGSTLKECACTLKAAGSSCVIAATVCKTPNHKKTMQSQDFR